MMLTWLPPTIIKDKRAGSNGRNHLFHCWYWGGHEHAAAIAAHEMRECSAKAVRALIGLVVVGGLYAAAATYMGWPLIYGLPLALVFGMGLPLLTMRGYRLNTRGEATECVVRRDYYRMDLTDALEEGAEQLRTYAGAPSDGGKRLALLIDEIPAAEKWVRGHRAVIEKALKLQRRPALD